MAALLTAWDLVRQLESEHVQACGRCQGAPSAQPGGRSGVPCEWGRDLRSLLRALALVNVAPDDHPRGLADGRALAERWLGRPLRDDTRAMLRARLDAEAAAALLDGAA